MSETKIHSCSSAKKCLSKLSNFITLDDSCAFVRHILANPEYKEWSQAAFGEKLGCFEKPSSTRDPTSNIDCPDITPLQFSERKMVNRDAMKVDDRLVHPDSESREKYCFGTALQMRKGKPSHRLKTCAYHDASLSKQGKLLKTMTQEAMQVSYPFNGGVSNKEKRNLAQL